MFKPKSSFVTMLIKKKRLVSVYLVSGIQLIGVIEDEDESTLILTYKRMKQVVYKRHIATIRRNEAKS